MTPPVEPGFRRVTVGLKTTGGRHSTLAPRVSPGCADRSSTRMAARRPECERRQVPLVATRPRSTARSPPYCPSTRRDRPTTNARTSAAKVRSRYLPVRGALLSLDNEAGCPTYRSSRRIFHPLGERPSVSSFRERAAARADKRWLSTTAFDVRRNVPRNLLRNVSLASRCAASFTFQSTPRNRTLQAKNTPNHHFLFHKL